MLVFQISFLRSELFSLFFSILSIDSPATSNAIENAVLGEQGWDFKSKKIWERIWATRILKLHCSLTNYLFFLGDADPESNDMKYPVLLMESVHKISQILPSDLNDKNRKKLARIMQNLGFDDLAPLFYEMPPDRERRVNIPFHINYSTFTSEYCSNVVLKFLLSLYATKVRGVIDMSQTSLSL